jgi:Ca-activated chloride channel family protein
VSFATPPVLLGWLALPALAVWYVAAQRHRVQAGAAFVTDALTASVAPLRPGPRRHIPMLLMALALALLIAAAAKPQVRVTQTVTGAVVMLANDVSNSMTSTDVSPSRLGAAERAAISFTEKVPSSIAIGSIEFARRPTLLQSPSTDHSLARTAIRKLTPGGGGTAIGVTIETALAAIKSAPKIAGKKAPGAIVLLSDGTSNVGVSPSAAAQQAKKQKVKIYTIAIGTTHGTEKDTFKGKTTDIPVPVNPSELKQIAQASGGSFYAAPDQTTAQAIYARLAQKLGHVKVQKSLIVEFAGAGLLLLLVGGGLSLRWFGALA